MAYNELGYTTLSVAEPLRGVSVGAPSCRARSVTEDNVPSGRARAQVPSVACQPKLCDVAEQSTNILFLLFALMNLLLPVWLKAYSQRNLLYLPKILSGCTLRLCQAERKKADFSNQIISQLC